MVSLSRRGLICCGLVGIETRNASFTSTPPKRRGARSLRNCTKGNYFVPFPILLQFISHNFPSRRFSRQVSFTVNNGNNCIYIFLGGRNPLRRQSCFFSSSEIRKMSRFRRYFPCFQERRRMKVTIMSWISLVLLPVALFVVAWFLLLSPEDDHDKGG